MHSDKHTTISEFKSWINEFVEARDWRQFHSLKNIAMNIGIESAELQEIFQWTKDDECQDKLVEQRQAIEMEVADIAFALINFCLLANIDLSQALANKIKHNAQKYPIEKVKGKAMKYTEIK